MILIDVLSFLLRRSTKSDRFPIKDSNDSVTCSARPCERFHKSHATNRSVSKPIVNTAAIRLAAGPEALILSEVAFSLAAFHRCNRGKTDARHVGGLSPSGNSFGSGKFNICHSVRHWSGKWPDRKITVLAGLPVARSRV
jgi:hypothetical protein